MKNKLTSLLVTIAAIAPLAAEADLVTWEFTGLLDESTAAGIDVNDPFKVQVSFDLDAELLLAQTGDRFDPGTRYVYDATDLSILISLPGMADQLLTATGDQNILWLRDDSGDRSCCEAPAVDGITFALGGTDYGASIIFRGSILDIYDGGALPSTPDPRLLDLELAEFFYQTVDGAVGGRITSARAVPEPGTLALLGLGLMGMGFRMRRLSADA